MRVADIARYIAAAMAGAAASALLMRCRRRRLLKAACAGPLAACADPPAACADPLARPFDCEVCRTRWRGKPPDLSTHLASKEHRRNLALLKSGSSDAGSGHQESKAADNLHCAYCNVWLRDAAAYGKHCAGKKHAGKVSIAGGTACYPFFDQQACILCTACALRVHCVCTAYTHTCHAHSPTSRRPSSRRRASRWPRRSAAPSE